jgi:hypothetical protein
LHVFTYCLSNLSALFIDIIEKCSVRAIRSLLLIVVIFFISGRFSEDQKRIEPPGEPYVQSATFHFITRNESLNPSCGLY